LRRQNESIEQLFSIYGSQHAMIVTQNAYSYLDLAVGLASAQAQWIEKSKRSSLSGEALSRH
jgi:hypothetical protein